MNLPMNNPIVALVNLMRSGGNPTMLVKQMVSQNPNMAQAVNMIQGKSPQQLKTIAENLAKERGTTVNSIAQSIGLM